MAVDMDSLTIPAEQIDRSLVLDPIDPTIDTLIDETLQHQIDCSADFNAEVTIKKTIF